MNPKSNIQMIVCLFAMALISVVLSVPLEGPAAAASPQEVVEASPELEAAPEAVIASPVVSPAAPIVAPVAPAVAPSGQGSDVGGTGTITEHKNPDGSVVTITRFNGQIPPHLFPNNQFGGGFGAPFYGPSPFYYGPWGPNPANYQRSH